MSLLEEGVKKKKTECMFRLYFFSLSNMHSWDMSLQV